jgi:hypothetical protein
MDFVTRTRSKHRTWDLYVDRKGVTIYRNKASEYWDMPMWQAVELCEFLGTLIQARPIDRDAQAAMDGG